MQTSLTSAEKTLAVPRADPPDSARTPAGTKGADPSGTPFDRIFHAASSRSDLVDTTGPAGFRTVENVDAPDSDLDTRAHDGAEDDPGASADTPTVPPGPATRPDVTRLAKAEADNPGPHHGTDADLSAPRIVPDGDPRIDQTDTDRQAMPMFDRAEPTRMDAVAPSHAGQAVAHRFETVGVAAARDIAGTRVSQGTTSSDGAVQTGSVVPERMPDRLPPDIEAQSLVAPASTKSDRGHGAALIDPLHLAPVVDGRRTIRGTDPAGWRMPMTRGLDDARASSPTGPTGAPALANTASPAVMQGREADALPSTRAVSALFADSASTDPADRGRDLDMPLGAELRGTSASNSGAATLATLPRSDLPQTIAMQIAAAIHRGGPGMTPGIELRLSPEELGTVRLTFTQSESGITVNVHAERAEILDLLRRNIDSLAREFLDIGYQSAEFTFDRRETGAQGTSQPVATVDPEAATETAPDAPRAINPTLLISDRLDIRL